MLRKLEDRFWKLEDHFWPEVLWMRIDNIIYVALFTAALIYFPKTAILPHSSFTIVPQSYNSKYLDSPKFKAKYKAVTFEFFRIPILGCFTRKDVEFQKIYGKGSTKVYSDIQSSILWHEGCDLAERTESYQHYRVVLSGTDYLVFHSGHPDFKLTARGQKQLSAQTRWAIYENEKIIRQN
ncbi:hypothetical protein [Vibrio rotiferianus]|nr:hypothetical protein [Vibrio rotiferianus]TMX73101.1 hypothetical protein DA097_00865 [Vibrio rotiferianus]